MRKKKVVKKNPKREHLGSLAVGIGQQGTCETDLRMVRVVAVVFRPLAYGM